MRLVIVVVVALVVAVLMTVFTIDLGPSLRKYAETEGTKFIDRPMHIGRLSAPAHARRRSWSRTWSSRG